MKSASTAGGRLWGGGLGCVRGLDMVGSRKKRATARVAPTGIPKHRRRGYLFRPPVILRSAATKNPVNRTSKPQNTGSFAGAQDDRRVLAASVGAGFPRPCGTWEEDGKRATTRVAPTDIPKDRRRGDPCGRPCWMRSEAGGSGGSKPPPYEHPGILSQGTTNRHPGTML